MAAEEIRQKLEVEIEQRRSDLAEHKKKSANTWDDVQIAEKTRLENEIKHLESIAELPAERITKQSFAGDQGDAAPRGSVRRAAQAFRVDRTGGSSLAADDAVRHADGRVRCSCWFAHS